MIKQFIKTVKIFHLVIPAILLVIFAWQIRGKYWTHYRGIIGWDVLSYYAYLPATFIYKDLSLGFIDKEPSPRWGERFWPLKIRSGQYVIKTTMGLSFLYAPFFFIAHPIAQIGGYEADGYSAPYRFLLMLSSLFYLGVGLYHLKKLLARFFTDGVTAITLLAVTIGTNLLHYATAEATMPHSYNFALFSIFLYCTLKWHEAKNRFGYSVILGLLAGLIVLIRPTNILIITLFAFWGVHDWESLKEKTLLLVKMFPYIIMMAVLSLLVWIPQFMYWKFISGSYWLYSYENERFFFASPNILRGLFGFRNGWLLYTPMMAPALAGIALMAKKRSDLFWPVLIFTVLNIYIILSWWSWWYGGSFGLRAFVDSYGILAIPFAVFLSWALERGAALKNAVGALVVFFFALNLFQTWQYEKTIIHPDSMSGKAYWSIFLKTERPSDFDKLIVRPDIEKALKGIED